MGEHRAGAEQPQPRNSGQVRADNPDVEGRLDSEAVGVRKAKQWLKKYETPPIDETLDEALLDYIARRTREIPEKS